MTSSDHCRTGRATPRCSGDIFTVVLAPYDDDGAFAGRIRFAVPRLGVGETAATGLALVIHELATNAVKYGALSKKEGTLDVSGELTSDKVEIRWTERGGPKVHKPDGPGGYTQRELFPVHRTVRSASSAAIAYVSGRMLVIDHAARRKRFYRRRHEPLRIFPLVNL